MAENAMTLGFNALKGMKTNSFARNIAGDENAVTIDVWMMRAAGLNSDSPNKTQYKELSQAVTDVAIEYRMTPRAMQALIWNQDVDLDSKEDVAEVAYAYAAVMMKARDE